MSQNIHQTAIVAESANIGADIEIGPYSVVGPDVTPLVTDAKRTAADHDANGMPEIAHLPDQPRRVMQVEEHRHGDA